MDPREERSARLLREKLFELARMRDISTVTAAELSRETGLSRRTIYNHGEGPQELLFAYLAESLTAIREDGFRRAQERSADESFAVGLRSVLAHVHDHREIYINAVSANTSPAWHHLLTQHFTESLLSFMEIYPPELPAGVALTTVEPRGEEGRVIASSLAHAMVGAIEACLKIDGDLNSEMCFRLVMALTPTWFIARSEPYPGSLAHSEHSD